MAHDRCGAGMELIVGTVRITPCAIHAIPGGIAADLHGDAVLSLLDAAFHGAGSIEMLGGALDRRPLDVTAIEMRGALTRITLICAGEAPLLN